VSDTLLCKLSCYECERREIPCGGVWRFHSQHGRYLLQCRPCRQKSRSCPFRRLEKDDEPQTRSKGRGRVYKRGERQRPISISDSESGRGYEETKVAGPSSCPQKKAEAKKEDGYHRLRDTLLEARKKKVEIETEAEIELARINTIIEEAKCDLKKVK
jgi:hypothetical protein